MAFALKLPSVEGLMRNRYVGRTFIEGTADRAAKARLKYTPLARSSCGQAGSARRGQHRPLDDDACPGSRDPRPRRRAGDPPARRLSADHRAVLLRDRHVAARRAVRHQVHRPSRRWCSAEAAQALMAKELGADSLRYLPGRGDRPLGQPVAPNASAAPASRPNTRRRPASNSTRSTPTVPATPMARGPARL